MVFPHRHRARMRVSLSIRRQGFPLLTAHSRLVLRGTESLTESLLAAQREMIEQEIFATLIREASSLPTASARVSERLVVIEAAQDTELRFEMVRGVECVPLS
jgi:mediator of RNA polymerase II transcription subunit 17, fungi type